MKFKVFDNGRNAKFPDFQVDPSWNRNEFNTQKEALDYANNWLGRFGPLPAESKEKIVGRYEYHYSGYGDIIAVVLTEK